MAERDADGVDGMSSAVVGGKMARQRMFIVEAYCMREAGGPPPSSLFAAMRGRREFRLDALGYS